VITSPHFDQNFATPNIFYDARCVISSGLDAPADRSIY